MATPAYSDIPKAANDLLGKDFPVGSTKLDVKTKAPNGVQFSVSGAQASSGAVNGRLEAKYADIPNGLTLTQAWDTANLLDTKIEIQDQIAKGLKVDVNSRFVPDSAKGKSASVALAYKYPNLHCRAFVDVLKRSFTGDVTVGHDGFVAGAEVGYDVPLGQISKYAATIGYSAAPYTVALQATSNLSVFAASYHHRVNPFVEASGKVTWDAKAAANAVGLEIGSKYTLDSVTYVKGKINNVGIAHLSYFQTLRPGVKLGLGLQLDTQRLNEPAHKVGLSMSFEA